MGQTWKCLENPVLLPVQILYCQNPLLGKHLVSFVSPVIPFCTFGDVQDFKAMNPIVCKLRTIVKILKFSAVFICVSFYPSPQLVMPVMGTVTMVTGPQMDWDVLNAEKGLMLPRGTTLAHLVVKTLTRVETPRQLRLMIVVSATNYFTNTYVTKTVSTVL